MHQFRILLCVAVCCTLAPLAHSVIQYKSQKIRGPPVPSRLTRNPQHLGTYTHQYQYTKSKRPQPQRNTGRPSNVRPIPVHMASYKVPVISRPPKTPAPLIFPSAVWKTPTAVYRPPVENSKPFFVNSPSSHQHQHQQQQYQNQQIQHQKIQQQQQQLQQPKIQLQQFDFHINKDPMLNIPTIKQIGEKGPIHTIPAPNLSPADKPKLIYEEPAKQSYYQYTKQQDLTPNSIPTSVPTTISNSIAPAALIGAQALPLVSSLPLPQIPNYHVQQTQIPNYQVQQTQYPVQQSAAQSHQYQVTENAEGAENLQQPFNGQKTYFAPDPDTNLIQKLTQYSDTNTNANNLKFYSQDMFVSPHQFVSNAANAPLSAQDLYQLLNSVPQQQLVDSYGMPLMQQPQLQQHFIQQAAQNAPSAQNYQFIQPQIDNAGYFNQIPETVSQQIKDNFKPQFQTFNYEEPKRDDFAQSRVTADYSIDPEAVDSSPKLVQQSPQEALAQTQYIQQYFQTREDSNVADNELESEHEGSTKASQILSQLSAKNEISPTMFYSSLPNKEAAEALANLQAAGSINTVLKLNQNKNEQNQNQGVSNSMRIYVPDDEEEASYDDLETGENNKRNQENAGFSIYETTHLKKDAENRSAESTEYEDYSGEESASSETSEQEANFGNKLKTKQTTR